MPNRKNTSITDTVKDDKTQEQLRAEMERCATCPKVIGTYDAIIEERIEKHYDPTHFRLNPVMSDVCGTCEYSHRNKGTYKK